MKKIILIATFFLTLTIISNAQVFNTASTLKKGAFGLGLEPALLTPGDAFYLFIHGGYGIKKGLDLGLKLGFGEGENYIGGDVEFKLRKNVSLAVGAHTFWYDIGIDGTLLFNIPIKSDIKLVTGFDADIAFAENDTEVPLWIPLGLEIMIKSKMALHIDTEISLTDDYHVLGGGLNFFF